jgi:hypothetical protein
MTEEYSDENISQDNNSNSFYASFKIYINKLGSSSSSGNGSGLQGQNIQLQPLTVSIPRDPTTLEPWKISEQKKLTIL